MFVAAVVISWNPHGRVVSPDCNVSLLVFTVRRAKKYKEALEYSANMYKSPDYADNQEEINKNIGRLQLRRLRTKHKQQLLAKKRQSIVKAGHGQSTSSESSSSSSMSDNTKSKKEMLLCCLLPQAFHKALAVSSPELERQPRSNQSATWQARQALHNRCFSNDTIMTSHFKRLILHNR